MNFCTQCGSKISDGEVFCGNCGAKVKVSAAQQSTVSSVPNNNISYNNNSGNSSNSNNSSNGAEEELYKKSLIGYYTGLTQISGTFLLTNKMFTYTPLPIYILNKKISLNLNEIADAERASVLGMNLCVRINTTSGKSHLFGFGIQNKNDIQMVVDLINRVKQGGRR